MDGAVARLPPGPLTSASPPLFSSTLSSPAPSPATLRAGKGGARLLRLKRSAFEAAFGGTTLKELCLAARCAALRKARSPMPLSDPPTFGLKPSFLRISIFFLTRCSLQVPLLAPLPAEALRKVASQLAAITVCAGERVVTAGGDGDTFFLVERGELAVLDGAGAEAATLSDGAYFGELALMAPSPAVPHNGSASSAAPASPERRRRKATVVAKTTVRLLAMRRAAFEALRGAHPAVADGLARGEAAYCPLAPPDAAKTAEDATASAVAALPRLRLADLQLRRALGVGTFGKVWLAHHNGKPYALKQIAKAQVVAKGLVAHVRRERDVMAECAPCRFLTALAASFQDGQSLYLLMELVLGGELFYYLQSLSAPLGEGSARFYTACVIEAFDFLHARSYLYRDLKPENLLICADGYIKVADFSFVKRLRAGKTFTLCVAAALRFRSSLCLVSFFCVVSITLSHTHACLRCYLHRCGTPAYLAPEQITRSGHDRSVDWWALGVLIYEMLAGASPFYSSDDMARAFQPVVCVSVAHARLFGVVTTPGHVEAHRGRQIYVPGPRAQNERRRQGRGAPRRHLSFASAPSHAPPLRAARPQISSLLQKAPHARLPMGRRGVGALRDHPWFRDLRWEALREGKLRAPYVPRSRDLEELRFFPDCGDDKPGSEYGMYTSVGNFAGF